MVKNSQQADEDQDWLSVEERPKATKKSYERKKSESSNEGDKRTT